MSVSAKFFPAVFFFALMLFLAPFQEAQAKSRAKCDKVISELYAKNSHDFVQDIKIEQIDDKIVTVILERNTNCKDHFLSKYAKYAYSYWRAIYVKKNKNILFTHSFYTGYEGKGFPNSVTIEYAGVSFALKTTLMGEIGVNGRIFSVDFTEDQIDQLANMYQSNKIEQSYQKSASIELFENEKRLGYGTSIYLPEFLGFYEVVKTRNYFSTK